MTTAIPKSRIALVTGANKGIGLAIVRNLALAYPASALSSPPSGGTKLPLLIYLTSRDSSRGKAALQYLEHEDTQLKQAKALATDGGLSTIKHASLDISNDASIKDMAAFLKREHPDGIDIVVNNAGIAMDGFDANVVKTTLAANYHGTVLAAQTLLPHMRAASTSRMVNVASMAGKFGSKYSTSVKKAFLDSKSVKDVTALMDQFAASVEKGTQSKDGWPSAAYAVSKAGLIGATRAMAREYKADGGQALINSCCPGYVDTDMTKGRGVKTIDQGAETPVHLALDGLNGVTGEFWENKAVSSW